MFFLKKIFQKNLNIDEIEDLLFDNGVEPKFADLIISKIKENKSQEEDIKKVIKDRESQISETLMSGALESIEHYKFLQGELSALYYLESEIKEYNKEL